MTDGNNGHKKAEPPSPASVWTEGVFSTLQTKSDNIPAIPFRCETKIPTIFPAPSTPMRLTNNVKKKQQRDHKIHPNVLKLNETASKELRQKHQEHDDARFQALLQDPSDADERRKWRKMYDSFRRVPSLAPQQTPNIIENFDQFLKNRNEPHRKLCEKYSFLANA